MRSMQIVKRDAVTENGWVEGGQVLYRGGLRCLTEGCLSPRPMDYISQAPRGAFQGGPQQVKGLQLRARGFFGWQRRVG